uniref:Uncharacterized protein n=1 Tax=Panstrongylus lignarius TaxID=156445 RepID=A0A224XRI7_9HEMI
MFVVKPLAALGLLSLSNNRAYMPPLANLFGFNNKLTRADSVLFSTFNLSCSDSIRFPKVFISSDESKTLGKYNTLLLWKLPVILIDWNSVE